MAFGWFKKIGTIIRKTDDVLDNPLIGALVRTLPGGAMAAVAIDAANKLFPQRGAGDEKREAVLKALRVYHPELASETALVTIEQILAAMKEPKV